VNDSIFFIAGLLLSFFLFFFERCTELRCMELLLPQKARILLLQKVRKMLTQKGRIILLLKLRIKLLQI